MLEDDLIKIVKNILVFYFALFYMYPYHILIDFYEIFYLIHYNIDVFFEDHL